MSDAGLGGAGAQPRRAPPRGVTEPKVVEVVLPNGTTMGVLATSDKGGADVGFFDKKSQAYDTNTLVDTIEGFAQLIQGAFEKAHPKKATIEFGFEIAVKSGKLTAILVEGSGKASLKVTMEWGG